MRCIEVLASEKRNEAKCRVTCMISAVTGILLGALVVGAVCGSGHCAAPRKPTSSPTRAPTRAPTSSIPGCFDNMRNFVETDVDCGGGCAPCKAYKRCRVNSDCQSRLCPSNDQKQVNASFCQESPNIFSAQPSEKWDKNNKGVLVAALPLQYSYAMHGGNCVNLYGKDAFGDPQWLKWNGDTSLPDAYWLGCHLLASRLSRPLANDVLPSDSPTKVVPAQGSLISAEKEAEMIQDSCYTLHRNPRGTARYSKSTWSTKSTYASSLSQSFAWSVKAEGSYAGVSASASVERSGVSASSSERETNNVGALISKSVDIALLENTCLQEGSKAAKYLDPKFIDLVSAAVNKYQAYQTTQTPWGDDEELVANVSRLAEYGAMLPVRWSYAFYQKYSMRATFEASSTVSTSEATTAITAAISYNSEAAASDTCGPAQCKKCSTAGACAKQSGCSYKKFSCEIATCDAPKGGKCTQNYCIKVNDTCINKNEPTHRALWSASASAAYSNSFSESLDAKSSSATLNVVQETMGNCNWYQTADQVNERSDPKAVGSYSGSDDTVINDWTLCDTENFREWGGQIPPIAERGILDITSLLNWDDISPKPSSKGDLKNMIYQYYSKRGGWFNYVQEADRYYEATIAMHDIGIAMHDIGGAMHILRDANVAGKVNERQKAIAKTLNGTLFPSAKGSSSSSSSTMAVGRTYLKNGLAVTFLSCSPLSSTSFSSAFCRLKADVESLKSACSQDSCLAKPAWYEKLTDGYEKARSATERGIFDQATAWQSDCRCPQYDHNICCDAVCAYEEEAIDKTRVNGPEKCGNCSYYDVKFKHTFGDRNFLHGCTKGCGNCAWGFVCTGKNGYNQGRCVAPDSNNLDLLTWIVPTAGQFCSAQMPGTSPTYVITLATAPSTEVSTVQSSATTDLSLVQMDTNTIVRCEFVL